MAMGNMYGNMGRSIGNMMESGIQSFDDGGIEGLGKGLMGLS